MHCSLSVEYFDVNNKMSLQFSPLNEAPATLQKWYFHNLTLPILILNCHFIQFLLHKIGINLRFPECFVRVCFDQLAYFVYLILLLRYHLIPFPTHFPIPFLFQFISFRILVFWLLIGWLFILIFYLFHNLFGFVFWTFFGVFFLLLFILFWCFGLGRLHFLLSVLFLLIPINLLFIPLLLLFTFIFQIWIITSSRLFRIHCLNLPNLIWINKLLTVYFCVAESGVNVNNNILQILFNQLGRINPPHIPKITILLLLILSIILIGFFDLGGVLRFLRFRSHFYLFITLYLKNL